MTNTPDRAITSQRVVTPEGVRAAAVLIKGEKILNVIPIENTPETCPIDDMGNNVIMPGLVDIHVHINEPGRTDWEGYETATRAAGSGGITTIVDMPLNCIPVTTTVNAFKIKLKSTYNKLWVDCGFYGGLIPENLDEMKPLVKSGVLGFKAFMSHSGIDEFPKVSETDLRNALSILTSYDLPLLVHAELEDHSNHDKDLHTYESYMATRPKSWENNAIKLLIKLCKEFQTPIHIVHLSSSEALDDITRARKEGLPISAETCPHYLHFTSEKITDGDTRFKCAPPIRDEENKKQLWEGLISGTIDFITSDHSPCLSELKKLSEGKFDLAWGGISSLQFSLSVIWTECIDQGLSFSHLTNWMSSNPAKFIGIDHCKGQISAGYDADLVCWNPDESFVVEPNIINFKNKITPYEGEKLFGIVKRTYLRGNTIFDRGQIMNGPLGKTILNSDAEKN